MANDSFVKRTGGGGFVGDVEKAFKAHDQKTQALKKVRKHPAHRILGMSHKQWVEEGKPKAHY